jgi:hypothetical protein
MVLVLSKHTQHNVRAPISLSMIAHRAVTTAETFINHLIVFIAARSKVKPCNLSGRISGARGGVTWTIMLS